MKNIAILCSKKNSKNICVVDITEDPHYLTVRTYSGEYGKKLKVVVNQISPNFDGGHEIALRKLHEICDSKISKGYIDIESKDYLGSLKITDFWIHSQLGGRMEFLGLTKEGFSDKESFLAQDLHNRYYGHPWYHSVGIQKTDNNTKLVVYLKRQLNANDRMVPAIFGGLFVCTKMIGKVEPA